MITDVFARRYAAVAIKPQYYKEDNMLCNQAWKMMSSGLLWDSYETEKISDSAEANFKAVHDVLALELGVEFLSDRWWFATYKFNGNEHRNANTYSYAIICKNFLTKIPDDMKGDAWMKQRLSFIELAFARRARQIAAANADLPNAIAKTELAERSMPVRGIRVPGNRANGVRAMNIRINGSFNGLVADLNERLRLALYRFSYHNGLIQMSDDALVDAQIEQPFWALVANAPWENVDCQMKEAIDCRDSGDRMAAFHAVSALESCIKIVSDTKGWTIGNERGAGAYVSNLVNKKNGSFLGAWEGELLTKLFSDVRNPFAHGAGKAAMPELTVEQTNWTIETSMNWIKTLVRRS